MHDAFDWWAQIWLPASVGAGTVFVSIAALVASGRATQLARDVEQQRELAATERATEAAQERLLRMAIEDARVLHRYAAEAYRPSGWHVSTPAGQPIQRTPFQQAQLDAFIALQQSLVPGAETILDLTQLDIENRTTWSPDQSSKDIDPRWHTDEWERLHSARADRTYSRIRRWALDPEQVATDLVQELAGARADKDAYLLAGQSASWRRSAPPKP